MSGQEVKQLVARLFIESERKTVVTIWNTLFIEGGKCLAIAYRAGNLNAVWCFEDQTLEFRDHNGKLLRTFLAPDYQRSPSLAA